MFDYKGRVADNSAYEFLLCDLFEVGEAELGEQFLSTFISKLAQRYVKYNRPCSEPGRLQGSLELGSQKRLLKHLMFARPDSA
jgi:hypothetical protein